jgi:ribulose-5-phosphate 4-epimerase/fuculose-1-phosphate aldolase
MLPRLTRPLRRFCSVASNVKCSITAPDIDQDMSRDGFKVNKWLKKPFEAVTKGETVCEIETEDFVLNVNSPTDGFLGSFYYKAGEALQSGDKLVDVLSVLKDEADGSAVRDDLASSHLLAVHHGIRKGNRGFFSAKVPGTFDQFYVAPKGLHSLEISEDKLLVVNGDGRNLDGDGEVDVDFVKLHSRASADSPYHKVMFFVQSPHVLALSMVEGAKLLPLNEEATRLSREMHYVKSFMNCVTDLNDDDLSHRIIIVPNRGAIVFAPTVAEAYIDTYALERAVATQCIASSLGPLSSRSELSKEEIDNEAEASRKHAKDYFDALKRTMKKGKGSTSA